MKDIFFQERGKEILLALAKRDGQYVTEVVADTGGTYAHTFNLLGTMEEAGIVEASKQGRRRYITLTPRGREIAALVEQLLALIDGRESAGRGERGKVGPRETITDAKLIHYRDALGAILQQVRKKKPPKKELKKYPRLLGRYKSLIRRLRPKGEAGKRMKTDILSTLGEVEAALRGLKLER